MKLKVAVLDRDVEFTNRLIKIFQQKYFDQLTLSAFSNKDSLYQSLGESYVDIVLVEQSMNIEHERISGNMVLGYLCSVPDVEEIDGYPAICKYQKTEAIYKLILDIYAEKSSNIKLKKNNTNTRIVMFASVQGGCGTSTAAAAYAIRKAAELKKIFYLNLEKFGNPNLYFSGDGVMSFSDVIYSLKSKKSNLALKIMSASRTDSSGVEFFSSCKNAYDMVELRNDEIKNLLRGISEAKEYDEIVLDLSGDLTERMLMLMQEYADSIVYVSDGSSVGNSKYERFCEVIRVMEQRQEFHILEKTRLLYNRYSSITSTQLKKTAVTVIGGVHRFEGAVDRELIKRVAETEALKRI